MTENLRVRCLAVAHSCELDTMEVMMTLTLVLGTVVPVVLQTAAVF